jgi:hypothetical protein
MLFPMILTILFIDLDSSHAWELVSELWTDLRNLLEPSGEGGDAQGVPSRVPLRDINFAIIY